MRYKKLWLTLGVLLLAALAVFIIYQINCSTCTSGGTFSYGAPGGLQ